jgi:CO/xanthine dehydrogenase Mo-binding subunit
VHEVCPNESGEIERSGRDFLSGRYSTDPVRGRGRGIAVAQYKNIQSYAAVVVELEVTDAADVKLHRVAVAADAGQVVDPAGPTAGAIANDLYRATGLRLRRLPFTPDAIRAAALG